MEIKPIHVGIPTSHMDFFASRQIGKQWCWAASIKMVLNAYSIAITQKQIVQRTYGSSANGNLPDWPATYKTIHKNLNNWSFDKNGQKYSVKATIGFGRPSHIWLINELNSQRPVIIAYKSGPITGHAVVLTGLAFAIKTIKPATITVNKLIYRDPWPDKENIQNKGRKEVSGLFANKIEAYWSIRVFKH